MELGSSIGLDLYVAEAMSSDRQQYLDSELLLATIKGQKIEDDMKVVPLRDDLMSATRYAFMSQRHSVSGEDPTWTKDLEYRNYGII